MSVRRSQPPLTPDALGRCVAALRGVAFWTNVALPLAYPPLLVALATNAAGTSALVAVVVANVAALVLGHGHRPHEQDTDDRSLEAQS